MASDLVVSKLFYSFARMENLIAHRYITYRRISDYSVEYARLFISPSLLGGLQGVRYLEEATRQNIFSFLQKV